MGERVTMYDVAREAGVSLMTVSRVVNDKGEVSQLTRQRVLAVIERLGYRPSGIARGLATQRTGTLGLVVPDIANPFFSDLARGVEDNAFAAGYNVFLCNTAEDIQREVAALESLEEKRVDGLVVCSSRLSDADLSAALGHHAAAVLVNRRLPSRAAGAVMLDDEAGAREATLHLLQAGHHAVGLLAGPEASYSGRQRVEGYRAVLGAAGLSYRPERVRHCSPGVGGGKTATRELLGDIPDLTALLCFNDLVAVGALQACVELGRNVPRDLAIIGYDDIPLAALVTPALTTCRNPRRAAGEEATRLLLDRIHGLSDDGREVVLQPELVVRASAP